MFYQSIQYKFFFSLVAILIRELLLQLLSIKGVDERSSSQKILKPFDFILLLQLLLFKGADECSSSQQILNPFDIILLLHLLLIKGADERTFESFGLLNNISVIRPYTNLVNPKFFKSTRKTKSTNSITRERSVWSSFFNSDT